jgi:sugar lactone lactonase YvrE
LGGLSPADLRSAYNLPSEGGEASEKVAITIAYDDPNANSDLKKYREKYGLPPCTEENGCFEKMNQYGEKKNYPSPSPSWAIETSLDLDMVSATCPKCHIVLIEAETSLDASLRLAVNTAASKGATVISDSWGGPESAEETSSDPYFHHPGIPVLFSSGDSGYGATYPAASPEVIAVGGTLLKKDQSARGWSEAAWSGAGSGCSAYEAKPAWQKDSGCAKRSIADVSAVADPASPVSVYDSYENIGWGLVGGTSVAAPLMAGVEALSTGAFRAAGPSAFYSIGKGGELFDVTEGSNGFCSTYLCNAGVGYDGPTGWGSPSGPLRLSSASTEAATIVSSKEAVLHGTISPEGRDTHYHFEYGTTTSYGTSVPVPARDAGAGTEPVAASETIKGLSARTTYHFRLVATNPEGVNSYGNDRTFGTTPPSATVESATEVHANSAVLHGSINPEGADTHVSIEYGPTNAYGDAIPLPAKGIGAGTTAIPVNESVGELSGRQTYHFRIKAFSAAGVSYSADQTFTTPPAEWKLGSVGSEGHGALTRVSCADARDCMAIGRDGSHFPSSYRWNGEAWSSVSMPNLEEELKEEILGWEPIGLSCSSSSACTAIAYYYNFPAEERKYVFERWNGSKWSLDRTAVSLLKSGSEIFGISCPTSSFCIVVGHGSLGPIAISWNGKEWSSMSPTSSNNTFQSISCTSASLCMAVGAYSPPGGPTESLSERWNGKEWSIFSVPNSVGSPLRSISCTGGEVAPLHCMAVAGSGSAWSWSGSAWTSVESIPTPTGAAVRQVDEVSCSFATKCTVVGPSVPAEGQRMFLQVPFSATWNGSGWSLRSTEDPAQTETPPGGEAGLYAVSCPSPSLCMSVGESETSHGVELPLVESFPPVATYSSSFASHGSGEHQLSEPSDLAVDASGNVWVADTENSRLEEFGPEGKFIRTVGSSGTGQGQFEGIYGVAISPNGNVWTSNCDDGHIEEFSSEGKFIKEFGSRGSGNGQFYCPEGLAVNAEGLLFVADRGNNRIVELTESGLVIQNFVNPAEGEGPSDVVLDSAGDVWATYYADSKVDEFGPNGTLIRSWGTHGSQAGQLNGAERLAIGPEGNIWLAEYETSRVQIFSRSGEYLNSFGSYGSGEGQFWHPRGVGFYGANIYVLDSGSWESNPNDRVEILR